MADTKTKEKPEEKPKVRATGYGVSGAVLNPAHPEYDVVMGFGPARGGVFGRQILEVTGSRGKGGSGNTLRGAAGGGMSQQELAARTAYLQNLMGYQYLADQANFARQLNVPGFGGQAPQYRPLSPAPVPAAGLAGAAGAPVSKAPSSFNRLEPQFDGHYLTPPLEGPPKTGLSATPASSSSPDAYAAASQQAAGTPAPQTTGPRTPIWPYGGSELFYAPDDTGSRVTTPEALPENARRQKEVLMQQFQEALDRKNASTFGYGDITDMYGATEQPPVEDPYEYSKSIWGRLARLIGVPY
jgi:hypothetical protein